MCHIQYENRLNDGGNYMLLIDVLKDADVKEIIRNQERDRFDDDKDLTEEDKVCIYEDFIKRLCELTPKVQDDKWLIGYKSFENIMVEEGEDPYREWTDVSLFYKSEIEENKDELAFLLNLPDLAKMTDKELRAANNKLEWKLSGYGFEFTPWEELLGCQVSKKNMKEVGVPQFLSYVLSEMTFNGFYRESQEERRQELEERIDELEEMLKRPKEEQDKYFIPAKKVFKELYDKHGIERPPKKTKKEKKERSRKLTRNIMWTWKNKAEHINRVFKLV